MRPDELDELRRTDPVSAPRIAAVMADTRPALRDTLAASRSAGTPERTLRIATPMQPVAASAPPVRRRGHLLGAAAVLVTLLLPAVLFAIAGRDGVDTPTPPLGGTIAGEEMPATDDLDPPDDVFSPAPSSTPPATPSTPPAAPTSGAPTPTGDNDATAIIPTVPTAPTEVVTPSTTDVPATEPAPEPAPPTDPATSSPEPDTGPEPESDPGTETTPTTTSEQPETPTRDVTMPFDPASDLLVVTLDFANRDDGHAAVATRELATTAGLRPLVIAGTQAPESTAFVQPYDELMRVAWADEWIDGADRTAAIAIAADRWVSTLDAGGTVRVAEGGVSDFTADVLRELAIRRPDLDTTTRIAVVHHAARNEDSTRPGDLDLVRSATTAVRIDDGNDPNGTADLNGPSEAFAAAALGGVHQAAWAVAFDYRPVGSLDFSDTVTVLAVLGMGLDQIADADDFARVVMTTR